MDAFVRRVALTSITGFSLLCAHARAQCLDWNSGFESGELLPFPPIALAVFDDGAGPALYAGGSFMTAADLPASRIARWNGSSWAPLASGVDGEVRALCVFDDGSGPALYVGGEFTTAGGLSAPSIARWKGSQWSAVGTGTNASIETLTVFDDGSGPALYAGGRFTLAGGQSAVGLARWDGASWSALGSGTNGAVFASAVFDDGSGPALHIGGTFTAAGGNPAARAAKWDGSTWSALGTGMNSTITELVTYDDGSGTALYAGGDFVTAGGNSANFVARWDGTQWSALGTGMNQFVAALCVFDEGSGPELIAGGGFSTAGGASASGFARWNGSSWSSYGGNPNSVVYSLATFDDGSGLALYAGGTLTAAQNGPTRVAIRRAGAWHKISRGVNGGVTSFALYDDGSGTALYTGGLFTSVGDLDAGRIARWDGTSWSALGSGMENPSESYTPYITSLCTFDGNSGPLLCAAGAFQVAGGVTANSIASWDGTSWSALGSGMNSVIWSCIGFDDGSGSSLFAGGTFTTAGGVGVSKIARWDGSAWSSLAGGMTGSNAKVTALCVYDDGSGPALYAGGFFTAAGGTPASSIAKWNGTSWSALGSGISGGTGEVLALTVFDDGSGPCLIAGGNFTSAGGAANSIARWNGTSWSPLGSGLALGIVTTLTVFDDGFGPRLYVGGQFTNAGGAPASRIASWDGSTWSPLGSGLNNTPSDMIGFDDGAGGGPDLMVCGGFSLAGGTSSYCLAQWLGCANTVESFCFGDGLDPTVTTACPCANFGQPGHGCGNSANPGGALLGASGTPNPDTIDLAISDMPAGVGSIYLQGNALIPAGVVFGDGIRCAGGVLVRLGLKNDTDLDGATSFGPGSGDPQISVLGAVSAGQSYFYQTYYRNPNAGWCPPATFNVSNALSIVWGV